MREGLTNDPALSVARTLGVAARAKGYSQKATSENEFLSLRTLYRMNGPRRQLDWLGYPQVALGFLFGPRAARIGPRGSWSAQRSRHFKLLSLSRKQRARR